MLLMQMTLTQIEFVNIKKTSVEYHDFYVQSNTLLWAVVFKNFQNMCLDIYELNLNRFLSTIELAWQAAI